MKESIAFGLLACFLVLATAILCAEVTHWRFQHGEYCMPCRDDYERAYMDASLWLLHCSKQNKQAHTWLVGSSRNASFQPNPELFKWEKQVCFGFVNNDSQLLRGWRKLPNVKLIQHAHAPENLELCTLGSLQGLLREPKKRPFRVITTTVTVSRRDVLDYFRWPLRTHDLVPVTYAADDEY